MKLRTKLRANERRQDTARLGAPQIIPLVGDGPRAQAVAASLRGGPDSALRRNKRGHWDSIPLPRTREMLVEARWRDWLAQRDERRVAA